MAVEAIDLVHHHDIEAPSGSILEELRQGGPVRIRLGGDPGVEILAGKALLAAELRTLGVFEGLLSG